MFERGQKILNKLKADGRTQAWLMRQLAAREIYVSSQAFLSNVLNGHYQKRLGIKIMDAAEAILKLK